MITAEIEKYVGTVQQSACDVEGPQLDLMAGIFDTSWRECAPDDILPPLWHWLLFQAPIKRSEIGADGHPQRGGFLPPIPLPRRMFAGARVEFLRSLRRGERVERRATIKSITPKSGRSGNLVFVTVQYEIVSDRGVAIREEQDLVYRESVSKRPSARPETPNTAAGIPSFAIEETIIPDPVMLFRFSAATGNSHRIHYDLPYAQNEEGYPDLVVHGPLQAMWLADICRRQLGRNLEMFTFKGLKPAFVNRPLRGTFRENESGVVLAVLDQFGEASLEARAR